MRFFYIPVQARQPQPATGATGVALDATLSWRPGREAASHKVYFGTDPNAVAKGTATGPDRHRPQLQPVRSSVRHDLLLESR